jgi:hypothetical protein
MIDSPDRWDRGDLGKSQSLLVSSDRQTAMVAGQKVKMNARDLDELMDVTVVATARKVYRQYRTSWRNVHMRMNVALTKVAMPTVISY